MTPHVHFVNKSALFRCGQLLLPQIGNFIAIASGKGGVGKSPCDSQPCRVPLQSLGFKTGILDCDLYGPSMPTMLGNGAKSRK
ncbi:MAG: P-loop NTPase [Saprospiraceae bacterium]